MDCNYITVEDLIEILKEFDGNRIVNVDWGDKFEIEENEDDNTINIIP